MMSNRDDKYDDATTQWAHERYPNINWQAVTDLNRMINWELWHGPLPSDYWTDVEPQNTPWPGDWTVAAARLIIELEPLPHEVWVDPDEVVYETDPADDAYYWQVTCSKCDEAMETNDGVITDLYTGGAHCPMGEDDAPHDTDGAPYWIGPENYRTVNVRHALLHDEVFKHVF